ncbi:MAG: GIY-YIG nuclease family protein [Cytophagales bacterium]|nr:GIY-YIG nuclease family protein [Cytophagales bacterium]MDW8383806.1 GIY-YIG nuclease family protein [Flammeovirgaceae bacterium]
MKFLVPEPDKYRSGVYVIRNSVDNRIYIGSSVQLYRRYQTHCQELENGTHHSKSLQRFYNKYGKNKLSFEVLAFCAPDKTFSTEQKYLNKFQPFGKKGFNTQRVAYISSSDKFLYSVQKWSKRIVYALSASAVLWLFVQYEQKINQAIRNSPQLMNWSE